jgi:hypothetical protein
MKIFFKRRTRHSIRKILKCVSRVVSSCGRLFLLFFFFPFKGKRTVTMTGGHGIPRHLKDLEERSDRLIAPSDAEFPDSDEDFDLVFSEEHDDDLEEHATPRKMAGHPCARRTNLADLANITTAIPTPTKARRGLIRFIRRNGRVVPVTDRPVDDDAQRERSEGGPVVVSPGAVADSLTDSAVLRGTDAADAAIDDENWCDVGDEKKGDEADEDSLESSPLILSEGRVPSARTAVSGPGFLPSIPAVSSTVSPVLDSFDLGVGNQNECLPLRYSSENTRSKKTKKQTS